MLPTPLLSLLLLLTAARFGSVSAQDDAPLDLDEPLEVDVPKVAPPQSEVEPGSVVCRPFGLCEPCPAEFLSQPYCQPYGNRRLIHCIPYASLPHAGGILDLVPDSLSGLPGETPAWEACGKVVSVELADYWEFVMCNVVFLAVAAFVYLVRTRTLAALQYRQLVARIGLVRGGQGWTSSS